MSRNRLLFTLKPSSKVLLSARRCCRHWERSIRYVTAADMVEVPCCTAVGKSCVLFEPTKVWIYDRNVLLAGLTVTLFACHVYLDWSSGEFGHHRHQGTVRHRLTHAFAQLLLKGSSTHLTSLSPPRDCMVFTLHWFGALLCQLIVLFWCLWYRSYRQ